MVERIDIKSGDTVGGYRIDAVLGEGSFGKVFRAKDASGGQFALKILKLWAVPPAVRQQLLARFDMEFETGKIDSNYLVRSYRHGLTDEIPWFTMEYCGGGNLMQKIESRRKADWKNIASNILCGLRDLHRCGKVHRDLKPENILFRADGSLALTDFGISGDRNKRLTERKIFGSPGQIFGTYAYMPPEQVAADRDATVLPTTDLFSFGAVMFFALTGQLPFGHLNDDNDLVDYMRRARDGKANLSLLKQNAENQQFVTLVSACLHPDFRRRVQTADEALALLSECESAGEQSAASDDTFEKTVRNGLLLHVMQGEDFHKVYRLNELLQGNSRIITIGRADGVSRNSIGINETLGCYISRRHCTLELDSATRRWYIRDGQWDAAASDGWRRSLNGTFVNSTEVGKDGMMISTGDIISIGEVKLRVEGY